MLPYVNTYFLGIFYFSSKNCVLIIFFSFFDQVSSFCNGVLTNPQPEIDRNFLELWNCFLSVELYVREETKCKKIIQNKRMQIKPTSASSNTKNKTHYSWLTTMFSTFQRCIQNPLEYL